MEPRLTAHCPFCDGELPGALEEDGRMLDLGEDTAPGALSADKPFIICPHCARPVVLSKTLQGELSVAGDQRHRVRL